MSNKRKIPMRKCVGCNERKPKREMIRIVRNPEGEVSIDLRGKVSGRGCYVCSSIDCLDLALKGKCVEKALETKVNQEVLLALKEEILKNA